MNMNEKERKCTAFYVAVVLIMKLIGKKAIGLLHA